MTLEGMRMAEICRNILPDKLFVQNIWNEKLWWQY